MRTVQMTLEESLVNQVDRVARKLGKTRSAFTRDALRLALRRLKEQEMERQHRHGYLMLPVEPAEFDDWEDEQAWGDS